MQKRPKAKAMSLPVAELVEHPDLQMRAGELVKDHVETLTEVLRKRGGQLERVEVWLVSDGPGEYAGKPTYFLTDGHYRKSAHLGAGKRLVPSKVYAGTWADALLAAAGANNTKFHQALRRTNDDKRRAVTLMLKHFPGWNPPKVAAAVGVSDQFVRNVRDELAGEGTIPTVGKLEGKDGQLYPTSKAKSKKSVVAEEATWRDTPIDEFHSLPGEFAEVVADAELETVGELYDALERGERFGLAPKKLYELIQAVKRVVPEQPAKPPEKPRSGRARGQSLRDLEGAVAALSRGPDAIVEEYPEEKGSAEHKRMGELLDEVVKVWKSWWNRLATEK